MSVTMYSGEFLVEPKGLIFKYISIVPIVQQLRKLKLIFISAVFPIYHSTNSSAKKQILFHEDNIIVLILDSGLGC